MQKLTLFSKTSFVNILSEFLSLEMIPFQKIWNLQKDEMILYYKQ